MGMAKMGAGGGMHQADIGIQIFVAGAGQASREVSKVEKRFVALQKRAELVGRGFRNMQGGFQSLSRVMRPAAFGGMIAAGLAVKESLNFGQAIAELSSVVGKAAYGMQRDIKNMALDRRNAATAIEAADAYTQFARSGVTAAKDLRKAVPIALRLASLDIKVSTEKSAKFVTQMAADWNKSFTFIGDILAQASDMIPGNVSDIMIGMQYASAGAGILGLTIQDAMAGVVNSIRLGLQPSTAGTAMGQLWVALSKEAKKKKLNTILEEAGFKPSYVRGTMRPLNNIIKDITAAFGALNQEMRGEKLDEVFGVRGGRAMGKLIKLIQTGKGDFKDIKDKLNETGVLLRKAEARMKGPLAGLKAIRSALGVISIDFVKSVFDATSINSFADSVISVAKAFGMLVDGASQAELRTKGTFSESTISIAVGLKEAIVGVKEAFRWLGTAVKDVANFFGVEGGGNIAKFLVIFAALAPVVMVFGVALISIVSVLRGVGLLMWGLGQAVVGFKARVILAYTSVYNFGISLANLGKTIIMASLTGITSAWQQFTVSCNAARFAAVKSNTVMAHAGKTWRIAGAGVMAMGKSLLAVGGPLAAAYLAMEGISAVVGLFSSKVKEVRAEARKPIQMNLTKLSMGMGGQFAKAMESEAVKEQAKGRYGSYLSRRYLKETPEATARGDLTGAGIMYRHGERAVGKVDPGAPMVRAAEKLAQAGMAFGEGLKGGLQEALTTMGLSSGKAEQFVGAVGEDKLKQIMKWMAVSISDVNASLGGAQKEVDAQTAVFQVNMTHSAQALRLLTRLLDETVVEAAKLKADAAAANAAALKKQKECLDANLSLNVGGRKLAGAVARVQLDLQERGGASVNQWQRYRVIQDGAQATGVA